MSKLLGGNFYEKRNPEKEHTYNRVYKTLVDYLLRIIVSQVYIEAEKEIILQWILIIMLKIPIVSNIV